jgi:hypothetical protein
MMQKDENSLLEFWFEYHAERFGARNLFIFDNGSTHPELIHLLKRISARGAKLIAEYTDHRSFCNKGLLFLEDIERLGEESHRFFIPLDCDEFLALDGSEGPTIDRRAIYRELMRCRRLAACQTTHCYLNHPFEPGLYRRAAFKKVVGTFSGIDWLGEGFHHVSAPMQQSGFSYIHLHYRSHDEFRARAAPDGCPDFRLAPRFI